MGPVPIEYASPVARRRHRPWGGLLALATYCASLLLPAIDFQLFNNAPTRVPGYAAAQFSFSMTFETLMGEWAGPYPILGALANSFVAASIAFMLFAPGRRAATWTPCGALACMLGCLPLYDELRVGFVVWMGSAAICLAAALMWRRTIGWESPVSRAS